MLKTTLAAGLIALGTLAAPAPASAGAVDADVRIGTPAGYGYLMTPHQARVHLRDHGFRNIAFFDRGAPVYGATAKTGRLDRVVVWIDARDGRIVGWEPVRTWRG